MLFRSRFLFAYIKECHSTQSLAPVLHNAPMVRNSLKKGRRLNLSRRAALQLFSSWFSLLCVSKTAGVLPAFVSRSATCPPIGMHTGAYNCLSFLCPGCRMREAHYTLKYLREQLGNPKGLHSDVKALVISCDVAFTLRSFGYEPLLEDADLCRRISRMFKKLKYVGCKTMGAMVEQEVPYYAVRVGLLPSEGSYDEMKAALDKLAIKIRAKNKHISSLTVTEVKGLDDLCVKLYDQCPLSLALLGKSGFSDSMLQHTVNELREAVKGKHKTTFFGTGV